MSKIFTGKQLVEIRELARKGSGLGILESSSKNHLNIDMETAYIRLIKRVFDDGTVDYITRIIYKENFLAEKELLGTSEIDGTFATFDEMMIYLKSELGI